MITSALRPSPASLRMSTASTSASATVASPCRIGAPAAAYTDTPGRQRHDRAQRRYAALRGYGIGQPAAGRGARALATASALAREEWKRALAAYAPGDRVRGRIAGGFAGISCARHRRRRSVGSARGARAATRRRPTAWWPRRVAASRSGGAPPEPGSRKSTALYRLARSLLAAGAAGRGHPGGGVRGTAAPPTARLPSSDSSHGQSSPGRTGRAIAPPTIARRETTPSTASTRCPTTSASGARPTWPSSAY